MTSSEKLTVNDTASVLTLANKITIVRILCVPIFILLLVYYVQALKHGEPSETQRWAALVIFTLVAVTDALDGYFARARNEVTKMGRVLDPLADKALLLSGLILLTRPSIAALSPQIPIWLTTIVISRDVLSMAGAWMIHHFAGRVDIKPRMSGKIATVLQMLAIMGALAQIPLPYFMTLVVGAGVFTTISGLQYLFDGLRQLENPSAT